MKMKLKLKNILTLAVLLVALTGCLNKESKIADPVQLSTTPPTSSSDFKLSSNEQEVYNNFQKDLNEQHLKGVGPISIAKIYIQASLDNKRDITYALYTDRKGHVLWTKEEFENFPVSDRGTKEEILKPFKNIETGKFIQTSDFEGFIEYQSRKDAEGKSGFQMIKDEDGIWNVAFQPVQ